MNPRKNAWNNKQEEEEVQENLERGGHISYTVREIEFFGTEQRVSPKQYF